MKVFLCIAVIAVGLTQVLGQYNHQKCCMSACCVNGGQYQCNMGTFTCFMGQQVRSGPRCGPGNNGVICAKPEVDKAEEDQSVGESYKQHWVNRWLNNLDEAEEDQSVGVSYKQHWRDRWDYGLDEAEEDQSVGDSYWANRWLNNLDEAEDEVVMPWQRRNSWSDCNRRCRLGNKFREFCVQMCLRDTPRRL
eukprot:g10412.t1